MKKAHTQTQLVKTNNILLLKTILCNINHQTVISETVKEIKLILIRRQGVEYNLQKLLPYPYIYKLLLSIPPTDF